MAKGRSTKIQLLWFGAAVMGLFAGLCTIFALIVTVAEASQEHSQAQWPEATARVESCDLRPVSTGRRQWYYVDCRFGYVVGNAEIMAKLYSRNVPSPEVWQYPRRNLYGQFEEWIDEHPQGTPIAVRYNPANPKKAVVVATDTPFGGPRTPNNLKLLGVAAVTCVVLLAIARIIRPRSAEVG